MKSVKKISSQNKSHSSENPSHAPSANEHNKNNKIKKKTSKTLKCVIRLLDDTQKPLEFSVSRDDSGQSVFTFVCKTIGDLTEYDYFGLRYRDKHDQEQWLDLASSVYKQLRKCKIPELCFRLKHYPSDPNKDLKQNITRYLVYLQIRRDFAHGRLVCPQPLVGNLGALIVQAELGDAPSLDETKMSQDSQTVDSRSDGASNPSDNLSSYSSRIQDYLRKFPIFHSQSSDQEKEIVHNHPLFRGLTAQEAESELLNRVARLPTYGIVPFAVTLHHKIDSAEAEKDGSTGEINKPNSMDHKNEKKHNLGISGNGLVTFVGLKKVQEFSWNEIQRLGCDGKQFIVYLKKEEPKFLKRLLRGKNRSFTYDCESAAAALALWRWSVDRKCFFTLSEAKEAKRLRPNSSIFHRNHTYRFSGRSYQELSTLPRDTKQPQFVRVSSLRNSEQPGLFQSKHATLPGLMRHMQSDEDKPNENRKSVSPTEIPNAVLVPSTVIEQPIEEAPVDIEFTPKEDQIKITPVLASDPIQTVGEILIESNEAQPLNSMPIRDSQHASSAPETDQDTMKIRDRVDSTLVHSVVYEQVLSALDQAIDDHDYSTADFGENKSDVLPNGETQRNGTCGDMVNGSVATKSRKQMAEEGGQCVTSDENHVTNRQDWSKDDSIKRPKLAAVAISLIVLVGLAVIIETTSTADFPVGRYLRSSALITGFENYLYTPVRKLVASGLAILWS